MIGINGTFGRLKQSGYKPLDLCFFMFINCPGGHKAQLKVQDDSEEILKSEEHNIGTLMTRI
jgi:hypothetical protein